jgi:hypothetical protein
MSTLNVITDEKSIERVKKAATGGTMRKVYSTMEAAIAAMQSLAPIAAELKIAIKTADPETFAAEGMQPVIAIVGARKEETGADGKKRGVVGIKGVAFFPIPTLDTFLSDEQGRDWLVKIAEKEAAHVIFRPLRSAESLEELDTAALPSSVAAIVMSSRADALDTDWLDAVWPMAREGLKLKAPKLYEALPKQKAELVKCLRSKSYAEGAYSVLEGANAFTGALAAFLMKAGELNKAEDGTSDPIDTSELTRWLDARDETNLAIPKPADYSAIAGQDFSKIDIGF